MASDSSTASGTAGVSGKKGFRRMGLHQKIDDRKKTPL